MSEHPTTQAGVSEPCDGNGGTESSTTESNSQPFAGDPAAGQVGAERSWTFGGFRTPRRFSGRQASAGLRQVAPDLARPHATSMTGIRRVAAKASGGYFRSRSDRPVEQRSYRPEPIPPTPYPELSTEMLLQPVKLPPSQGWRRWLYVLSGRLINVGESPRAMRYNNLVAQINRPLRGSYRVAVLSLKGGVGKTTITAALGSTFASIRGDRVVAVDANPDRGTLSQKVALETSATVRQLLRDAEEIQRYGEVRGYTSQALSGLEVLVSESDPALSDEFDADDYTRALEILERFYGLVLTDCGTGMLHSTMTAILANADVLIVISSAAIDGARSASATLDWLEAHGHDHLVRNSIVVINGVRPSSGKVNLHKVVDHFSRRCRAVLQMPFDPHLEVGAEISLDQLKRQTREALTELAAVVADGFPDRVLKA